MDKILENKWISIKRYKLHYIVTKKKNKKTFVLVHGLSVSGRYMLPTATELAKEYTVYSPDLPGFGKSNTTSDILSISELTDALAAFIKEMKIEKAVFIGNSLGFQIITDFAIRYPQYITHGVVIGPAMDGNARSLLQQIGRLLLDTLYEPVSYLLVVLKEYFDAGFKRTIKTALMSLDVPIEKQLPKVKIPVLIIRGQNDQIVTQEWAKKVANLIPKSNLVIIPKVAHVVNFSGPKQLVKQVKKFLDL